MVFNNRLALDYSERQTHGWMNSFILMKMSPFCAHQWIGSEPVGKHHPLSVGIKLIVIPLQIVRFILNPHARLVATLFPSEKLKEDIYVN